MPDTEQGWRLLHRVQRTLRILVATNVLLFVVLAAAVGWASVQAGRTHDALCTLRGDLEGRVEQGRRFLDAHPNGAFGFSAAEIRQNIRSQDRTIRSLQDLGC